MLKVNIYNLYNIKLLYRLLHFIKLCLMRIFLLLCLKLIIIKMELDKHFYSRQIDTYSIEFMEKISKLNIYVYGLRGVQYI